MNCYVLGGSFNGNVSELVCVQKYLSSGEIMIKESLDHSFISGELVMYDEFAEIFYRVCTQEQLSL